MGKITIIGTGFFKDQLTLGAVEAFRAASKVILHTARCGAAEYLKAKGIAWTSLDQLYEEYEDFDEHAQAAAEAVKTAAREGDVAYGVFDLRDTSAHILASEGAAVLAGPPAEGALMAMTEGQTRLITASQWEDARVEAAMSTIVREIDSRELAAEVKLKLSEAYPDDAPALFLTEAGVSSIKLYELDRQAGYSHMCAALVLPEEDPTRKNACDMEDLMRLARRGDLYAPGDFDALCEDAARLAARCAYAQDRGEFTLWDVITAACGNLFQENG